MHIYFLKLNVLDAPGQSVWNQVWWKKNTRQGESLFCKHILAGEDIVYYFSFQVYLYRKNKTAHNMDTNAMFKNHEIVVFW